MSIFCITKRSGTSSNMTIFFMLKSVIMMIEYCINAWMDWYFYNIVQKHYPQIGNIINFGHHQKLKCVVLSNHRNNRILILKVIDKRWQGNNYIMIGYVQNVWPCFIICLIDGDMGEAYGAHLIRSNDYFSHFAPHESISRVPAVDMVTFADDFDRVCINIKNARTMLSLYVSFKVKDWRVYSHNIIRATRCIQQQWKECISNPNYLLCQMRLYGEFEELFMNRG